MYLLLKFGISAAVIVAVAEIAKRSTWLGALLASLPLTSLLAMIWLYRDTKDAERIAVLSGEILWLVVPSLLLFILLPIFLRRGVGFYAALGLSCAGTALAYLITSFVMHRFGVKV